MVGLLEWNESGQIAATMSVFAELNQTYILYDLLG